MVELLLLFRLLRSSSQMTHTSHRKEREMANQTGQRDERREALSCQTLGFVFESLTLADVETLTQRYWLREIQGTHGCRVVEHRWNLTGIQITGAQLSVLLRMARQSQSNDTFARVLRVSLPAPCGEFREQDSSRQDILSPLFHQWTDRK